MPDSRTRRQKSNSVIKTSRHQPTQPARFQDAIKIAQETGLLRGARTRVVRGRMPDALVKRAKENTGAKTDTELIEVALANLAVADKYMEWLVSQAGTIPKDIDLEY